MTLFHTSRHQGTIEYHQETLMTALGKEIRRMNLSAPWSTLRWLLLDDLTPLVELPTWVWDMDRR